MKRVREKLKSTRGASVLFALLVFILCMFAGVAALVAASSNIGRFAHAEADQQQYLSVGSAVELLKDELGTAKLEFSRELIKTRQWSHTTITDPATGEITAIDTDETTYALEETVLPADSSSLLAKLVEEACRDVFEAKYVPADWYTKTDNDIPALPGSLTKTFTVTAANDNLVDVHAALEMNPASCMITVTLWAGEEDTGAYKATVLLPVKVTQSNTTLPPVTTGNANNGETVTATTVTATLEWPGDGIMITKD